MAIAQHYAQQGDRRLVIAAPYQRIAPALKGAIALVDPLAIAPAVVATPLFDPLLSPEQLTAFKAFYLPTKT